MLNKILLNVGFYALIVAALLYFVYMLVVINDLRADNEQLQQEIAELEIRNIDLQLQRDALIDGAWHEHNKRMMEGEDD